MGEDRCEIDHSQRELVFNGIDGSTGRYLTPPLTPREVTTLATSGATDEEETEELRRRWFRKTAPHFLPTAGINAQDLSEAGWGVVFGPGVGDAAKEALQPLLDLRREQAGDRYSDFPGPKAFRGGDTKHSFLGRLGAGSGPANPAKVPYYLLLVGDPESIPYRFQYQLDVQYAVGRIHFTHPKEYAHYAGSVLQAEAGETTRPRKITFFGSRNSDDRATHMSADYLITPLEESAARRHPTWKTERRVGPDATRASLAQLLQSHEAPALLVSASHGMAFPKGDPRQLPHQGALLCQDWPGPLEHEGPIPEEFYVAGDHIENGTHADGLIAFFFACYGGGTPRTDDFAHLGLQQRRDIASKSFLADLPKRLLGRSHGALAVMGHVERAWTYSFLWNQAGRQLEVFESAITSLLNGQRVGSAMEWFNMRYAELSSDLVVALEDRRYRRARPEAETMSEDLELAGIWTASNDARNYVVLGDPAVRLAVNQASDLNPG